MRILAVSDSHGKYDSLYDVIMNHLEDTDLVVFLGDGEKEAELISYEISPVPMVIVSGNCDYGSERMDYDIISVSSHRIFATHGYRFGVKSSYDEAIKQAKKNDCDILLFGHTHVAYEGYEDGIYLMNPGSIGKPRDGYPSYGIIDITDRGIFMHTVKVE